MVPFYYVNLFLGNLLVGWLGGLLEKMPATSFWLLHAAIIATSAAILFVVRIVAGHTLAPDYDHAADATVTAGL
jgi:POT family proton-dependent oligopeptide transporter